MTTRDRSSRRPPVDEAFDSGKTTLDVHDISDDDLDALFFEEDEAETSGGFLNWTSAAGLSLILVGIVYLLAELGLWSGPDFSGLWQALPIIGGILVILMGFGLLSWRSKDDAAPQHAPPLPDVDTDEAPRNDPARERLMRARYEKKLFGVCGGLAKRFGLDPTLVRIAFVIGTVLSSGVPFVIGYIAMAYVMPKEPERSIEERLRALEKEYRA
ncbi:PspC domain-containing protein [Salisaeta longa]|uniref:PspC domain-containing protein n=1 Tax=Salisaeta longa TaxID=503170 RepID=UPI0003B6E943|nr:PspC domain-containing protein [Salisaeta longa]